MAARKAGLGRGLSALLEEMGTAAPDGSEGRSAAMLPIGLIDPSPRQPRRAFDEAALAELADSIRTKGVLQPILVRPAADGRYEIVAGERRWRASQLAGQHDIPVIVRSFTEADGFEAALIENIQRADLNAIEEAEGYRRLVRDFGHTQDMVATVTGKARSHVANLMRLLDLPDDVQTLVKMGLLTQGHAKAVLGAKAPGALAREVAERGLTVRQTEEAARRSHEVAGKAKPAKVAKPDADREALESQLAEVLGLPVSIKAKSGRGSLTVKFSDLDQLDSIIAKLQS